ncbi:hypothetical protein E2C01_017416 [Portunus trituberculatus]|uniref:Uncharacterized protein n=1 Tax=Portunus trituberculatus TaxID=210409 RepID=A0A5B7DST0_PORTR|nr:hypothetical protein [Portunus trituberculatus]
MIIHARHHFASLRLLLPDDASFILAQTLDPVLLARCCEDDSSEGVQSTHCIASPHAPGPTGAISSLEILGNKTLNKRSKGALCFRTQKRLVLPPT